MRSQHIYSFLLETLDAPGPLCRIKMKKILNILVISLMGTSCSFITNNNSLRVEVKNEIDGDKIQIEHGISATTGNRKNDKLIFDQRDNYQIIYSNGTSKNVINEYGENDFLVTYNDSLYFAFRQFKTNRRNNHSLVLKITKEKESHFVEVIISGENELIIEGEMNPINESYKYLANKLRRNYYKNSKDCFEDIQNYKQESEDYITANNKLFQKRSDKSIHILTCNIDGHIYLRAIKTNIDFKTAKEIGEFWIDKNHVYGNYETSDGEMLYKIPEANVKSFKTFDNSIYGKDDKFVYNIRHGKVENADSKTFMPVYIKDYHSTAWGKDKSNYYFWDEIVKDTIEFKKNMKIE